MSQSYNAIYIDLVTGQEFYTDRVIQDGMAQFHCVQSTPSYVWVLNHGQNTNKFVITVVSDGQKIYPASIVVNDINTITITFTNPTMGEVFLMLFDVGAIPPTPTPTPSIGGLTPFTLNVTNAFGYEFYACGASNNASIDWGDGTITPIPNGASDGSDDACVNGITHQYDTVGDYTIKVYGDYINNGTITAGVFFYLAVGDLGGSSTVVTTWGTYNITNINLPQDITFVPNFIPTTLTNLSFMFADAKTFNQDISSWDTSNVTNMSIMLGGTLLFNRDISSWNTSNVTDMSFMFQNTLVFNQDLSSWNTSHVTTMSSMFNNATAFNGNIGSWDTSNVTDMSAMFVNASSFNGNIGSWNTSNVTAMSQMFQSASAFNQDIGSWNTSKVTDMSYMFYSAYAFNQDLSHWCVTLIPSVPSNFDLSATSWVLSRPVWGTCPA
jgi:surface protein